MSTTALVLYCVKQRSRLGLFRKVKAQFGNINAIDGGCGAMAFTVRCNPREDAETMLIPWMVDEAT